MEFLNKALSGSDEVSAMRLMSLISLTTGMIIAIIGLFKSTNLSELSVLCGVFVGAAFGGKAVQKFAEK